MSTRIEVLAAIGLIAFALGCKNTSDTDTDDDTGATGFEATQLPCLDGRYCPDGCSCNSTSGVGECVHDGGTSPCRFSDLADDDEPPMYTDLAGDWAESWFCIDYIDCISAFDEAFGLSQDGSDIGVAFDAGDSLDGILSGRNFTWTVDEPQWEEVGVWTFTDPVTCTKTSVWRFKDESDGGLCFGIAYKSSGGLPGNLDLPDECL